MSTLRVLQAIACTFTETGDGGSNLREVLDAQIEYITHSSGLVVPATRRKAIEWMLAQPFNTQMEFWPNVQHKEIHTVLKELVIG